MKPSIYPIDTPADGTLYIMPKPSGEWLDDDLAHLQALGITTVVSLLDPAEARLLGLEHESAACAEKGMDFRNLPIPDRGLPKEAAFVALAGWIAEELRSGRSVAVHCRAGIGRAGMTTACTLREFGLSAEDAIAAVSRARGIDIPDTPRQRELIYEYPVES